jgi:hypothetical protein
VLEEIATVTLLTERINRRAEPIPATMLDKLLLKQQAGSENGSCSRRR